MVDSNSEVEFLHQTLNFFEISFKRFNVTLDNVSSYMVPHFKERWDIHENLYTLSVENQRNYLEKVLSDKKKSIYEELKRDNIVQTVRKKFGDTGLDK